MRKVAPRKRPTEAKANFETLHFHFACNRHDIERGYTADDFDTETYLASYKTI